VQDAAFVKKDARPRCTAHERLPQPTPAHQAALLPNHRPRDGTQQRQNFMELLVEAIFT
jgi:hypothetical protein